MANHDNNAGGFSHAAVETSNPLMIVMILLVLLVGGMLEIVPLFFQKSTTEPIKGVQPYTALQLAGRALRNDAGRGDHRWAHLSDGAPVGNFGLARNGRRRREGATFSRGRSQQGEMRLGPRSLSRRMKVVCLHASEPDWKPALSLESFGPSRPQSPLPIEREARLPWNLKIPLLKTSHASDNL